ncbi:hypothetical protein ACI2L4_25120 [Streptomyces sparsogenes]|uniref:hypothetical protein n=1 Tax=Streptomyces sparsogenes TaxID=67365 RepID=UPI00384C8305
MLKTSTPNLRTVKENYRHIRSAGLDVSRNAKSAYGRAERSLMTVSKRMERRKRLA